MATNASVHLATGILTSYCLLSHALPNAGKLQYALSIAKHRRVAFFIWQFQLGHVAMPQEREVEIPNNTRTVRVMIVSDVRLYRDGLAESLAQIEGFTVVCTARYADEGARIAACRPDVLVLDMGARGSVDVIRRVAASESNIRTVAFAVRETERDIVTCAEAGAAGYVARDGTLDDLVNTIRSVARGELLCTPRIAAALFRALHENAPRPERNRLALTLTAREREIAPLLDRGLSNKEIATQLHIEVATVKNHVHNLLEKLHVASRGEAAARLRSDRGMSLFQSTMAHPMRRADDVV
ncbi:MAG: response regulator transcription factor [Gemmatimonadaceae bacterium]